MKKLFFILPLCLLIVSAFANIIMAAHVSDVGARIHDYESKALKLSAHNDEMLQTLASKQSLVEMRAWALSQGFVPRDQLLVVREQAPKIASIAIR